MTTKKKIITIAGVPGSGKSTTAKNVAKKLSYSHFSSGDLFREVAAEHGVDIATINQIAESQDDIDFKVDQKLRDMGTTEKDLVIDSRTAFHWIPQSFKVYLKLDIDIASERVFRQIQFGGRKSQTAANQQEVRVDIETRMTSELKRYGILYDLDYTEEDHYDLVIDTNLYTVEEVSEMILAAYTEKHLAK
jgi:CMP/dCMP kinase